MYFYDFEDPEQNLARYGQTKAPYYDVGKITSRTMSFWRGTNDKTATPEDSEYLINDLKGKSTLSNSLTFTLVDITTL